MFHQKTLWFSFGFLVSARLLLFWWYLRGTPQCKFWISPVVIFSHGMEEKLTENWFFSFNSVISHFSSFSWFLLGIHWIHVFMLFQQEKWTNPTNRMQWCGLQRATSQQKRCATTVCGMYLCCSARVFCRATKALPALWPETFSRKQWKVEKLVENVGFQKNHLQVGTNHWLHVSLDFPGLRTASTSMSLFRRSSRRQGRVLGSLAGHPASETESRRWRRFKVFTRFLASRRWKTQRTSYKLGFCMVSTSYLLGFCILKHLTCLYCRAHKPTC